MIRTLSQGAEDILRKIINQSLDVPSDDEERKNTEIFLRELRDAKLIQLQLSSSGRDKITLLYEGKKYFD